MISPSTQCTLYTPVKRRCLRTALFHPSGVRSSVRCSPYPLYHYIIGTEYTVRWAVPVLLPRHRNPDGDPRKCPIRVSSLYRRIRLCSSATDLLSLHSQSRPHRNMPSTPPQYGAHWYVSRGYQSPIQELIGRCSQFMILSTHLSVSPVIINREYCPTVSRLSDSNTAWLRDQCSCLMSKTWVIARWI